MEIITVMMAGKPQAKQRHVVLRNGFKYTPPETINFEKYVKWCYAQKSNYFFDCAVKLNVYVFMTPPQSVSKKKYQDMINGVKKPTKKPDWDNLGKSVSDALNKVSYHDDGAITYGCVIKRYAEKDCLVFTLQEDNEVVPDEIMELVKVA